MHLSNESEALRFVFREQARVLVEGPQPAQHLDTVKLLDNMLRVDVGVV